MSISATLGECCPADSAQYKVTATDGETTHSVGYQSSPTGLMSDYGQSGHKIRYYAPTDAGTKTVTLTFEVKDCEGNVETLVVTLTNAYINTT